MDNIENPEVVDLSLLKKLKSKSKYLVFFANGKDLPSIDFIKDITIIGYKLGEVKNNPPNVYWGFKYAPVNKKKMNKIDRKNNVLIALGGAKDVIGIKKVFKAISKVDNILNVCYLESPVNPFKVDKSLLRSNQSLKIYYNLPEIQPILSEAGLVAEIQRTLY